MSILLAMHMANELLSLPVAGITLIIAILSVAMAARRAERLRAMIGCLLWGLWARSYSRPR